MSSIGDSRSSTDTAFIPYYRSYIRDQRCESAAYGQFSEYIVPALVLYLPPNTSLTTLGVVETAGYTDKMHNTATLQMKLATAMFIVLIVP